MKRKVFLIVLAAALCFAATSVADSDGLTFPQTCWTKLSRDVTLYYQVSENDPLKAVGTLSAGTYVREVGGSSENGKICIMFADFGNYG